MPWRKAFTLIELLVVISIIALLIAILLPALNRAREQAKVSVCQTHVRQLNMGLYYYAEENDDKVIPVLGPTGLYWFNEIAPYLGEKGFRRDPQQYLEGAMEVLQCPSVRQAAIPGQWGTANRPWTYNWGNVADSYSEGAYIINSWMQPPVGYYTYNRSDPEYDYFYWKYTEASSETPVFADGMWVDCWPRDTDNPPTFFDGVTVSNNMQRVCIDRHDMAVNVGFAGGAVRKVPLEGLWFLKWHKAFKPKEMFFQ